MRICFCGKEARPNQRNCLACHAAAMRASRAINKPTEAQRVKDRCRSYANVYQRRGKLQPAPCEKCGSKLSQKHHDDYAKPLQVRWLCRQCHLDFHRAEELAQKREFDALVRRNLRAPQCLRSSISC